MTMMMMVGTHTPQYIEGHTHYYSLSNPPLPAKTDNPRGPILLARASGVGAQKRWWSPSPPSKSPQTLPCLKESKRFRHVSNGERHADEESVAPLRWLCHGRGVHHPLPPSSTSPRPPFLFLLFFFFLNGSRFPFFFFPFSAFMWEIIIALWKLTCKN